MTDGSHIRLECLIRECKECNTTYKEDPNGVEVHQCIVSKPDPESLGLPEKYRIITYDFEATMDDETNIHVPYCVTAIRLVSYKLSKIMYIGILEIVKIVIIPNSISWKNVQPVVLEGI